MVIFTRFWNHLVFLKRKEKKAETSASLDSHFSICILCTTCIIPRKAALQIYLKANKQEMSSTKLLLRVTLLSVISAAPNWKGSNLKGVWNAAICQCDSSLTPTATKASAPKEEQENLTVSVYDATKANV